MGLTPTQAAAAVGKAKSTIIKAIHQGRLSATRELDGTFSIDAAELFRVYPPAPRWTVDEGSQGVDTQVDNAVDGQVDEGRHLALQVEVKMLRELVSAHVETIDDLRRRLDRAADEQEKMGARLLALQQPQPTQKGWWQRLLGGGA